MQQWKAITVFLVAVALVLAPWAIHNRIHFGAATISTMYEKSLLYYQAAALIADSRKISIDEARDLLRQVALQELIKSGLSNTEIHRTQVEGRLGRQILFTAPFRYLKLHLIEDAKNLLPGAGYLQQIWGTDNSAFDTWGAIRSQGISRGIDAYFLGKKSAKWLMAPFVLLLAAVYAGCGIGLIVLIGQRQWFPLIFLVIIISYFLLLPGFSSNSRFRVPVMPQIDLLAAFGWIAFRERLLRKQDSSRRGVQGRTICVHQ